jgi:hypothetical protein
MRSAPQEEAMLNQRQLFVASRLFVVAGKAGVPFDLSRFSNDRNYALTTLSSLASQLTEPSAQAVVAEALLSLSEVDNFEHAAALPAKPVPPTEASADKYVGRLR